VHTPAYLFNIRRMGKGGRGSYGPNDVDIFALVALDTRTIGYLPENEVTQSMIFRLREHQGQYYDERLADRREDIIALRAEGLSFREIGKRLDVDAAQVYRIATGKQGNSNMGRYLDSLSFEAALDGLS